MLSILSRSNKRASKTIILAGEINCAISVVAISLPMGKNDLKIEYINSSPSRAVPPEFNLTNNVGSSEEETSASLRGRGWNRNKKKRTDNEKNK